MSNFSTKQIINAVQHQQKHGTSDAATRKRLGMLQIVAIDVLKKHAGTLVSDAFLYLGRPRERL